MVLQRPPALNLDSPYSLSNMDTAQPTARAVQNQLLISGLLGLEILASRLARTPVRISAYHPSRTITYKLLPLHSAARD